MAYKTIEEFKEALAYLRGKKGTELSEYKDLYYLVTNAKVMDSSGEKFNYYDEKDQYLPYYGLTTASHEGKDILIRFDDDSDPYVARFNKDGALEISEEPMTAEQFAAAHPIPYAEEPRSPRFYAWVGHYISKFFGGTGVQSVNDYNMKKGFHDRCVYEAQRAAGYNPPMPESVKEYERVNIVEAYLGAAGISEKDVPKFGKRFDELCRDPRIDALRENEAVRDYFESERSFREKIKKDQYYTEAQKAHVNNKFQFVANEAFRVMEPERAEELEREQMERIAQKGKGPADRGQVILYRLRKALNLEENGPAAEDDDFEFSREEDAEEMEKEQASRELYESVEQLVNGPEAKKYRDVFSATTSAVFVAIRDLKVADPDMNILETIQNTVEEQKGDVQHLNKAILERVDINERNREPSLGSNASF